MVELRVRLWSDSAPCLITRFVKKSLSENYLGAGLLTTVPLVSRMLSIELTVCSAHSNSEPGTYFTTKKPADAPGFFVAQTELLLTLRTIQVG